MHFFDGFLGLQSDAPRGIKILVAAKEAEERGEVFHCNPQQWTQPFNGSAELVKIAEGPGVVLDRKLQGYNSPLMDPKSQVNPRAGVLDFVLPDFKSSVVLMVLERIMLR